jgi:hypothetical protein
LVTDTSLVDSSSIVRRTVRFETSGRKPCRGCLFPGQKTYVARALLSASGCECIDGDAKADPPRGRTCVRKKNPPVVKEKSYFAPTNDAQARKPCRGSELERRGRSPETPGISMFLPRVDSLLAGSPASKRSCRCKQFRPVVKTRVTSPPKRVDAGSNPATGVMPV